MGVEGSHADFRDGRIDAVDAKRWAERMVSKIDSVVNRPCTSRKGTCDVTRVTQRKPLPAGWGMTLISSVIFDPSQLGDEIVLVVYLETRSHERLLVEGSKHNAIDDSADRHTDGMLQPSAHRFARCRAGFSRLP